MSSIKVVVTGRRTTVYQKAHRTAEVLYTDRVAELIKSGALVMVRESTVYVDKNEEPAAVVNAPSRKELTEQAEGLGIEVRTSWAKAKISEEIAAAITKMSEMETYQGETSPVGEHQGEPQGEPQAETSTESKVVPWRGLLTTSPGEEDEQPDISV